ncbi:hypothetical protein M427DRAFT_220958 [Gonapodya prolifera JEL478]|uniref:Uncharacterized protein n=1 Tax=Gonapodya prolifera (strain JEL478) TaxID=1344416 RepID=A0A138ZZ31_GONPJ|nr:hypothetical protein M427DRAFT_220958 [Gonapodya prolifera JEL478]|eukprot:KXS09535.1 hypothetical protein M427DRAFT_220958 [Gonapodya prolifera JEL478]
MLYDLYSSSPLEQAAPIWEKLTSQIARSSEAIRDAVMNRALDDLKKREKSTTPVLYVVMHIIKSEMKESSPSYADKLCEMRNLTGLLYEDLAFTKKGMKLVRDSSSLECDSYLNELKQRLENLVVLMQAGEKARDTICSTTAVNYLWRLFVVDAILTTERDLAFMHFRQLGKVRNLSAQGIITEFPVGEFLCMELIPTLQVDYLGHDAFALIRDSINIRYSMLSKPVTPSSLKLISPLLWALALNYTDETVGLDAVTLLVDIYMRENSEQLMVDLIESAAAYALAGVREMANGESAPSLGRAIVILQTFLDRAALLEFGPEPVEGVPGSAVKIRAQISIDGQEQISAEFTCHLKSTIREIIAKVARIVHTHTRIIPHTVRVLRGGKEWTDSKDKTIEALGSGQIESMSFMVRSVRVLCQRGCSQAFNRHSYCFVGLPIDVGK